MHQLFQVNIDGYNIIQLADWIKKSRSAIMLNDKKVYIEDYNKFSSDVFDFCEEWKVYFELHKRKFTSNEFSQALKLSVLPRPKYLLRTSDNIEIDITDDFEEMQFQNLISSNLIKKSIDRESSRAKEYSKLIDELLYGSDKRKQEDSVLDGRRETLHNIINLLSLETTTYEINILEKEALAKKSVKQIINSVKRGKWHTIERKITPEENKTLSYYLIAKIRENHINKNVFYSFSKNKPEDKIRLYGKQFLFNVGFFIGLTLKEMEQILRNEGYTMQSSLRKDDKIIYDCFYYFFSQQYASALLNKDGYPTLDI